MTSGYPQGPTTTNGPTPGVLEPQSASAPEWASSKSSRPHSPPDHSDSRTTRGRRVARLGSFCPSYLRYVSRFESDTPAARASKGESSRVEVQEVQVAAVERGPDRVDRDHRWSGLRRQRRNRSPNRPPPSRRTAVSKWDSRSVTPMGNGASGVSRKRDSCGPIRPGAGSTHRRSP